MKEILYKLKKCFGLSLKFFLFCKEQGILSALKRVREYFLVKTKLRSIAKTNKEDIKSVEISNKFKISLAVPLYNTPQKLLIEMVESIRNQTYQNWQLCLADGSSEGFAYIEEIVNNYKDKRIFYRKLDKNYGISENTNLCIQMADGEYIGLLDHDDLLPCNALAEVMYAAEKYEADFIYTDECVFETSPDRPISIYYKPDFSMDTLRSYNYISHFVVFSKDLYQKAGYFRSDFDCSQDYDIYLRLLEHAKKVIHIPKILYYWRSHSNSTATDITLKPDILDKAKLALQDHLNRSGLDGKVYDSPARGIYRIHYKIKGNPLVSIVIARNNCNEDLCIKSIKQKTLYGNYELIEVNAPTIPVMYNEGSKRAKGEYIIFISDNTEVIEPCWIDELLMLAQRDDVGIVGSKLYYSDNTISHAGIVLGLYGAVGYGHRNFPGNHTGYMCRMYATQNVSAVSGACMMVKKEVFDQCNGFNESYKGAYFDVDFCLRVSEKGYKTIFTPYAELYHHSEKNRIAIYSQLPLMDENEDRNKFLSTWWKEIESGDRYYNPNLTLESDNFSFK